MRNLTLSGPKTHRARIPTSPPSFRIAGLVPAFAKTRSFIRLWQVPPRIKHRQQKADKAFTRLWDSIHWFLRLCKKAVQDCYPLKAKESTPSRDSTPAVLPRSQRNRTVKTIKAIQYRQNCWKLMKQQLFCLRECRFRSSASQRKTHRSSDQKSVSFSYLRVDVNVEVPSRIATGALLPPRERSSLTKFHDLLTM